MADDICIICHAPAGEHDCDENIARQSVSAWKEIEALRAQLAEAQAARASLIDNAAEAVAEIESLHDKLAARDAEVGRLRGVLEAIDMFGHGDGHGRGYTCANMAIAALQGEG